MAGGEGGNRGQDGWMTSSIQWTGVGPLDSMGIESLDSMDVGRLQEMVKDKGARPMCCSLWGCKESDITKQLSNNNVYTGVCPLPCLL